MCAPAPPAPARTRIAVPGATLVVPRIGVASAMNQPAAANSDQPRSSGSGSSPAKIGSAPRRFDHTHPSAPRVPSVGSSRFS